MKKMRQRDLVEYKCVGCGNVFRTQLRRIKPMGNWCCPCKMRDINSRRIYESPSEEVRKKMGAAHLGKPSWSLGKKFSEEHRKNLSIALKGRTAWNKGVRRVPKEQRLFNEKIHDCCSGMVRRVLKIKNEKKVRKTFDYLGYTKSQFVSTIEKQFRDGMSWANYGEWHVDHIVPVSYFVSIGVTDVRTINSLNNLQPLWESENASKGARFMTKPSKL